MIFAVNSENRNQFAANLEEMHRQRKIVFVDRGGWKLPVLADGEVDCYDREESMYLLAKDGPEGQVLASARLLPTTVPHLMSCLLGDACREEPPREPTVWEVSRFCTTPELNRREVRLGLLWEVICGVMETALLYGIEQFIVTANRALLPLALNCGWEARTLGPSLRDADDEVSAVAAMITPAGLCTVRRRHGFCAPVTRLLANAPPRGPNPFACKPPLEAAQGVPYPGGWIGQLCYDWPRA